MLKILITGASGFLGRNVTEYFSKKNDIYHVFYPSSKELDCLDQDVVKEYLMMHKFDLVFHFAVYGDGIDKTKDASKIVEYNLRIYFNFANNSHLYGKMFYTGSGAEYDKRFDICSVTEEEIGKTLPEDSYGFMKYIVGRDIEQRKNIYNLRLFGIFGKYEYWKTKFISNICCKQIKNIPLTIRQNVYFDYLWVDDFSRILETLISKELQFQTYNITSGERIDLIGLCKIVQKIHGEQSAILIGKEGLAKEYTASNQRLLQEVPETRITKIEDAIYHLYHWYQDHEQEIDRLPLLYQ